MRDGEDESGQPEASGTSWHAEHSLLRTLPALMILLQLTWTTRDLESLVAHMKATPVVLSMTLSADRSVKNMILQLHVGAMGIARCRKYYVGGCHACASNSRRSYLCVCKDFVRDFDTLLDVNATFGTSVVRRSITKFIVDIDQKAEISMPITWTHPEVSYINLRIFL